MKDLNSDESVLRRGSVHWTGGGWISERGLDCLSVCPCLRQILAPLRISLPLVRPKFVSRDLKSAGGDVPQAAAEKDVCLSGSAAFD